MKNRFEHINDDTLVAFLSGNLSLQAMEQVEEWISVSEENKQHFETLETLWLETGNPPSASIAVDTAAAWEKISARIKPEAKVKPIKKESRIKPMRQIWYAAAAVLLLISLFGIYKLTSETEPQFAVIETQNESLTTQLADGSEITVNSQSSLEYIEDINSADTRQVKLKGEAFFKVAHKPEAPFIIDAGEAYVKVLGTEFNVDAGTDSVSVYVQSGRVMLYKIAENGVDTLSVILTAGEQGSFGLKTSVTKSEAQKENANAMFWRNKTLIFDDTPIPEVAETLEKYYGIKITFADAKIQGKKLNTKFENQEIDYIIEVLSLNGINIRKQDSVYVFSSAE